MEKTRNILIEETAPGTGNMDRDWMTTFWETFSDCVIETDADYKVRNILRKTDSTFTMVNIIGRSFLDIAVDSERASAAAELEYLKTPDIPYRRFTFLSRLGRYYRWTMIPIYRDGIFSGSRGIAVDVTEQSLNEITLNWQSAIIEGSSDFISITGMDGHVLYTNPGAYGMTGYDPELGPISPELIFKPDHLKLIQTEGIKKAVEKGSWICLCDLVRKNGSILPVEHNMFSIKNERDETVLIATVISDITDFVENERKLEEARNAAEAANIAKSEFLSRMSHEIRTPMNAIIGMINIGLGADDTSKKNYCFRRADSASRHLLGIINDILDMSKIEADKFELSFGEFDFEQALKNIANMANVRAEEKKQNFIVDIWENVPARIVSDELRLSQVITNLLTNAIKFTPEKGTITLRVEKTGEQNGEVNLRTEISDSGIGISKEQQGRLFMSFNQADASISQKFGGTGLGLAISKRIVELMGGKIWIESELGRGAKFIFTIKAKIAEGGAGVKLLDSIDREKVRVLVADDSEEIRNYFANVMKTLNLACETVSDGEQALHVAESAKDNPYDLVFLDWQMPFMNGLELTKKIKEINSSGSVVLIISANDWNTAEKDAAAAGVAHVISKPLFPSMLINAVNVCLGAGKDITAESAKDDNSGHRHDFSGFGILVAEDLDINREIMSAILGGTGVSVDFAENGKIAVSMFRENPGKYDLILMDINMPEMDGYSATRQIRSSNTVKAAEIPIIAMTANVFREDIEKCLAAGMNDHTGKPVDADALLDLLDKYFSGSGQKNDKTRDLYEKAKSFPWDENFNTGNPMIDAQHKKIFELVSNLAMACEDGNETDILEELLAFLVNYSIRHFADEEALMLENGFPDYLHSKHEHNVFKEKAAGLVHRFRESGSSSELSRDVEEIILKWLVNHIGNENKRMSQYIRNM